MSAVRLQLPLCIAAGLAVAALAGGCRGGDEEGACAEAPALTRAPALPDGFPTPSGVTYTSSREAGPGTVVAGFRETARVDVLEAYRDALETVGYRVSDGARGEDTSALRFSGGGAEGQVRLRTCDGRTAIEITVRRS